MKTWSLLPNPLRPPLGVSTPSDAPPQGPAGGLQEDPTLCLEDPAKNIFPLLAEIYNLRRILNQGRSVPQGTFGNVWGHSWWSCEGGGMLLASGG